MKSVKIPYPANLSSQQEYLFKDIDYTLVHYPVKREKNVFLCRSGIALKRLLLIKESVHRGCRHLYKTFYKVAIGSFILHKKKKLQPGQYLLLHNIWSRGYYHWICEALPRLWDVKDEIGNYTLVLPDNYKGFHTSSLKHFQFKAIIYIPPRTSLFIPELVIPSNQVNLYEPDPEKCDLIRNYYYDSAEAGLINTGDFGERIYVSRSKAKNRRVRNEAELEAILLKYGFRIIVFEDYDFWEQVAIMKQTRVLVSIHGAGLTNMQFMRAGGVVLELYKTREAGIDYGRGRDSDLPSPCYCRLAAALDHHHYIQFCEAADPNTPAGEADIVVDKNEFEQNLVLMLKGQKDEQ